MVKRLKRGLDYETDALTITKLGEHSQTDETWGTCKVMLPVNSLSWTQGSEET